MGAGHGIDWSRGRRSAAAAAMLLAGVAGLVLAGCDRWFVRMETRMDRSGRLERETRITYDPHEEASADRPPIEDVFVLPGGARYEERGPERVVLHMSAATPADLEEPDFAVPGEGERPRPRNAIAWRVEDCVLFERYVYREELRDNVVAEQRRRAIDEIHRLLEEVALEAAVRLTDARYETRALEDWLATDGRMLLVDLIRIFEREKDAAARDALLLARLRAEAPGLDEALPPDTESEPRSGTDEDLLTRFAAWRLASLLVPATDDTPPVDPRALLAPTPDGGSRLGLAVEETIEGSHGTKDAFFKRLLEVGKGIAGDMDSKAISFEARVTLPGRILRTNGIIERPADDATVLFVFDAKDVARTGQALDVETVIMKPERLFALAAPKPALDGRDILDVLATLDAVDVADQEGRAALGHAFTRMADDGVDAGRAGLPDELRPAFDKLVEIGSRD